jgi:hypothetical protein
VGKDFTLYSLIDGIVVFKKNKYIKKVGTGAIVYLLQWMAVCGGVPCWQGLSKLCIASLFHHEYANVLFVCTVMVSAWLSVSRLLRLGLRVAEHSMLVLFRTSLRFFWTSETMLCTCHSGTLRELCLLYQLMRVGSCDRSIRCRGKPWVQVMVNFRVQVSVVPVEEYVVPEGQQVKEGSRKMRRKELYKPRALLREESMDGQVLAAVA